MNNTEQMKVANLSTKYHRRVAELLFLSSHNLPFDRFLGSYFDIGYENGLCMSHIFQNCSTQFHSFCNKLLRVRIFRLIYKPTNTVYFRCIPTCITFESSTENKLELYTTINVDSCRLEASAS